MYLIWLIETNPTIPIGEKFINFYIVVHLVQEKCDKLFLITKFSSFGARKCKINAERS